MTQGPIIYEWECPICGTTRISLTHSWGYPVEDEAKNAVIGHIRQSSGNGHGEAGEIPPGLDESPIADNVRFKEQFGGRETVGG